MNPLLAIEWIGRRRLLVLAAGVALEVLAILTGWLSSSLVETNRARAVADRERAAAHALRSPIATIHGLVEVLAVRDRTDEVDLRIIGSIEDETERLLRSEVFESHRRTS